MFGAKGCQDDEDPSSLGRSTFSLSNGVTLRSRGVNAPVSHLVARVYVVYVCHNFPFAKMTPFWPDRLKRERESVVVLWLLRCTALVAVVRMYGIGPFPRRSCEPAAAWSASRGKRNNHLGICVVHVCKPFDVWRDRRKRSWEPASQQMRAFPWRPVSVAETVRLPKRSVDGVLVCSRPGVSDYSP